MLITNKGLDDHVVMILQPDQRSPRASSGNRPVTRAASSRALSEMPVLTEPRSKATSRTGDFEDCRSCASGDLRPRDVRDVEDVRDVRDVETPGTSGTLGTSGTSGTLWRFWEGFSFGLNRSRRSRFHRINQLVVRDVVHFGHQLGKPKTDHTNLLLQASNLS